MKLIVSYYTELPFRKFLFPRNPKLLDLQTRYSKLYHECLCKFASFKHAQLKNWDLNENLFHQLNIITNHSLNTIANYSLDIVTKLRIYIFANSKIQKFKYSNFQKFKYSSTNCSQYILSLTKYSLSNILHISAYWIASHPLPVNFPPTICFLIHHPLNSLLNTQSKSPQEPSERKACNGCSQACSADIYEPWKSLSSA